MSVRKSKKMAKYVVYRWRGQFNVSLHPTITGKQYPEHLLNTYNYIAYLRLAYLSVFNFSFDAS